MQPYPHHYVASARGRPVSSVTISAPGLTPIEAAAPPEFDGPGGLWSPETLLAAAVANCFVLTFRSVTRAARFEWIALECRAEGTLDRAEGQSRFTAFATTARLTVSAGADVTKARRLLEQAERACLVANSLRAERALSTEVVTEESTADAPRVA